MNESKKPYVQPEIILEEELETRAGSGCEWPEDELNLCN